MDTRNIGRIIKEARLNKKMTQNEVVGDFITRNMLSQIESGAAMPSVRTLNYLCEVLDINIEASELRQDSTGEVSYLSVRQSFCDGRYEEVIGADAIGEFGDEMTALRARSYLALAGKLSASEDIADGQRAIEYCKKASELADKGIFADSDIKAQAAELLKASAAKLSAYYSSLM